MAEDRDAAAVLEAGGLSLPAGADARITGRDPVLESRHHVGEAAATAATLAAAWAARFGERRGLPPQSVRVDVQAAAATLMGFLLQSIEREPLVRVFSPVTALFTTGDGRRIHLHGGFPHLEAGTCELLACEPVTDSLAAAVSTWTATELEGALAGAGLCGAIVRAPEEWAEHPQGRAVVGLPAIRLTRIGDAAPTRPTPAARPLGGVRVLDLTRVLAGPTAGRTLAGHGADVLRVDGSHLPTIEVFDIETGRGKRSAFCDLRDADDRERLSALVDEADVFVHGYRQDALDRHGFGVDELVARRPGLVVVRLNCYGPDGPWATRRGWEQLAQSACGIAYGENPADPHLVPAAATDYTTGYLAAAGVAEALCRRADVGGAWSVEVSLAQTASWLQRLGADLDPADAIGVGDVSARQRTIDSAWGRLTQLAPIERLSVTPAGWDTPPAPRGSSALVW